jgi:hypothetical protein
MGQRPLIYITVLLLLAALACNVNFSTKDETPKNNQTAPLVLLLAPVNGSTYAEGTRVEFHAIAQDSLAGVSRIEFRVDDLPAAEAKTSDPSGQQPSLEAQFTWTASGKQGHLITVEAFRADGSSLGLYDVSIKVTDQPSAQTLAVGTGAPPDNDSAGAGPGTAVPTPTQVATPPPSSASNQAVTSSGPGTHYSSPGIRVMGDSLPIVGRNTDSTWWAVMYTDEFGDGTAWVLAALTVVEGDISQIPLVEAPPPD